MFRCKACASAYLDPRPSIAAISMAYQNYITHDAVPCYASQQFLKKIQDRLANGYRNYRYGTRDYPANMIGILVAHLLPNKKATIDAGMRHLAPKKGRGRLLDIGFGNGLFLSRTKAAGWNAVGVDTDLKVVERAEKDGLDVHAGGIESIDPSEKFDVITMAHVIEHLHHPVEALRTCYQLLAPNGVLWIETPNITSLGHQLFGPDWRGIEPPRHLVLFNLNALSSALKDAGFNKIEIQPYRPICDFIFSSSLAIANGKDPYSQSGHHIPSGIVKKAERIARRDPRQREFITFKAWKH